GTKLINKNAAHSITLLLEHLNSILHLQLRDTTKDVSFGTGPNVKHTLFSNLLSKVLRPSDKLVILDPGRWIERLTNRRRIQANLLTNSDIRHILILQLHSIGDLGRLFGILRNGLTSAKLSSVDTETFRNLLLRQTLGLKVCNGSKEGSVVLIRIVSRTPRIAA